MERNPRGRPRHPDVLTPAEWRVLDELREGGTNAEIASRLSISGDAVKYHISNMLGKLELRDRRELADWRPDAQRGRLRGFFAIPAALAYVARPLAWVGVGTAAVIGVVVVIVVAQSVAGGGGDQGAVLLPPTPLPVGDEGMSSVDRCATPTDADCILAVYLGAPDDYARVEDIPADVLLKPDDDGRYIVRRGQQVTVVTRASLPDGWTRFDLRRSPTGTPSPVSFDLLIQPLGTTYTFTVTDDEAGASVITYDLVAARPNPVRPGQRTQLGDVVVTTEFLVPTLRYDTLDIAGAATAPGSYAFLWTAGDTTSGAEVIYSASGAVELRVHPTDANGVSRAALYDAVRVGDAFDFRTNGLDCGRRFSVTDVSTSATAMVFGIETVRAYGGWCDGVAADSVEFIWKVRPGIVGPDGVRVPLRDEPLTEGTYRLSPDVDFLFDVPEGVQVIVRGVYGCDCPGDAEYTGPAVVLVDATTTSQLEINPKTGDELARRAVSSEVDDLFDQIVSSIRPLE